MTSESLPDLALRQGRLRPEAEARYPWAPSGTWLTASTLAAAAMRHSSGAAAPPAARVLPDEAFEFRGGRPEVMLRRRARTRWSDYSYPSAALHRRGRAVTP